MRTKTTMKGGKHHNQINHNQTVVRKKKLAAKDVGRKKGGVKTGIKSGHFYVFKSRAT